MNTGGLTAKPKLKAGGWEVYIKCGNAQPWSKSSCAKTEVGDGTLNATVELARNIMCERARNNGGDGRDGDYDK